MNIEPLKTILSFSKNKQDTLLDYLPNTIKLKVQNLDLEDKEFYINDMVFCIKKNTLELECYGKIICIDKYKLGIRKNQMNQYIDSRNYYIFIKVTKKLKNQRDFLEKLLEKM